MKNKIINWLNEFGKSETQKAEETLAFQIEKAKEILFPQILPNKYLKAAAEGEKNSPYDVANLIINSIVSQDKQSQLEKMGLRKLEITNENTKKELPFIMYKADKSGNYVQIELYSGGNE